MNQPADGRPERGNVVRRHRRPLVQHPRRRGRYILHDTSSAVAAEGRRRDPRHRREVRRQPGHRHRLVSRSRSPTSPGPRRLRAAARADLRLGRPATGRSASAGASRCRRSPARPTRACRATRRRRLGRVRPRRRRGPRARCSTRTGGIADDAARQRRRLYAIRRYRPRIEGLFARIERWTQHDDRRRPLALDLAATTSLTFYGKRRRIAASPTRPIRPHLHLADLRDPRRQGQRDRLRLQGARTTPDVDLTQRPRAQPRRRDDARAPPTATSSASATATRTPLLDADAAPAARLTQTAIDAHALDVRGRLRLRRARPRPRPRRDDGRHAGRAAPTRSRPTAPGFEVRTYRLCQRVLMFHHFPERAGRRCATAWCARLDFAYRERRRRGQRQRRPRLQLPARGDAVELSARRRARGIERSLPPRRVRVQRGDDRRSECASVDAASAREPARRARRAATSGSTSTARASPASSPSRPAPGSTSRNLGDGAVPARASARCAPVARAALDRRAQSAAGSS